ncbi:MAG TPA: ribbon-helix-helix protein, CopG family [Clostridia bacterium]|mgnify:CR=1 FL=1|nr:ribbon-helix-helix protein, CopG family [Clostridia bacterium]
MADQKKVLLSMPDTMLSELDRLASEDGINRSELIRHAMKLYIEHRHKIEIRERMKRGYEAMAIINREWAETGIVSEYAALDAYEAILSESD